MSDKGHPTVAIRGWRLAAILGILALAPGGLWLANEHMARVRGPSWASANFDPSYAYLLNSLALSEGAMPGHTDHPGTTVQLFGALGLHLLHPQADAPERVKSVLIAPELNHRWLVKIAIMLTCILWVVVGWWIWRQSGSLSIALACQALPLGFKETYFALAQLTPELLFPALSGLFSMLATESIRKRPQQGWMFAAVSGLLAATAIVTKVNWLPIAGLLLFVPQSWKLRALALLAAAVSLALWLLPIWGRLPGMLKWFYQIGTHAGHYGDGPSGLPSYSELSTNLIGLWSNEPMHWCIALVMVLGLALPWFDRRSSVHKAEASTGRRMLWLLGGGALGVLGLAAKHPAHHYVLPIAAVSPAVLLLALDGIRRGVFGWAKFFAPGIAIVMLTATVILGRAGFRQWTSSYVETEKIRIATAARIGLLPDDRVVHFYRTSSVAYALLFGNGYVHNRYSLQLQQLYPDEISFNIFNLKFETYGRWVEPVDFFARNQPILLIGSTDISSFQDARRFPLPANWQMLTLQAPQGVYIYRLIPPQ